MYLHILFSDKSNPWVHTNIDEKTKEKDLKHWGKHYTLRLLEENELGVTYKATKKGSE